MRRMMGILMNKLMLSCEDATLLVSIKAFRKLKMMERIQLRLHLLACVYCKRFDKQNHLIDHGINELLKNGHSHLECMPTEKKEALQRAIDQTIDR